MKLNVPATVRTCVTLGRWGPLRATHGLDTTASTIPTSQVMRRLASPCPKVLRYAKRQVRSSLRPFAPTVKSMEASRAL